MQNRLSWPDRLQLGQQPPAFGHRLRQDLTRPAPLGLQLARCSPGDLSASVTVREPAPRDPWVHVSSPLYTSTRNTRHTCVLSLWRTCRPRQGQRPACPAAGLSWWQLPGALLPSPWAGASSSRTQGSPISQVSSSPRPLAPCLPVPGSLPHFAGACPSCPRNAS